MIVGAAAAVVDDVATPGVDAAVAPSGIVLVVVVHLAAAALVQHATIHGERWEWQWSQSGTVRWGTAMRTGSVR